MLNLGLEAQEQTVPRKVLILNFVNQAKDSKSDYLSLSIAEALLDPLKKTGKFYLLPRSVASDQGNENAVIKSDGAPAKPETPPPKSEATNIKLDTSSAKSEPPPPMPDLNRAKPDANSTKPDLTTTKPAANSTEQNPAQAKPDAPLDSRGAPMTKSTDIPAPSTPAIDNRNNQQNTSQATYDENEALRRAKSVEADVVVIGNFISVENTVQIQTKAIDVHTGQIVVAKTRMGKLDASIFATIQSLVNDMSDEMAAKLPPIPKQIVIREQGGIKLYAKNFHSHVFLGTGFEAGTPSAYLRPGFAAHADIQFEFIHPYIQPYFSFSGMSANGLQTVNSMSIFSATGGLAYPMRLAKAYWVVRSLSFNPFLAAGSSFGTIKATPDLITQSFPYRVFTLSLGTTVDAFIADNWSIAASIRADYLFESQTPLSIIYCQIGAGYKI